MRTNDWIVAFAEFVFECKRNKKTTQDVKFLMLKAFAKGLSYTIKHELLTAFYLSSSFEESTLGKVIKWYLDGKISYKECLEELELAVEEGQ